ncbi:endolytic transglycosylase MltG [Aminipila butyrica]|uniref:Endolytic transglycosylase MltG n=1 Tax=Aminipila butyrica TaxID=433296 RepID=A0A858BZK4_9FIRM|nr:endolytic transglycosylase MltG [Aminipila butyrica]QIB70184.1 endolytic transglycosylase MltG [Aminipila butyrica]
MRKIKDILYDTSDILTACFIVLAASLVIWASIGNIMDYPAFVAAQSQKEEVNTNFGLAVPVGDGTSGGAVTNGGTGGDSESPYSIYINYGESTNTIAQRFVDVGLFDSVSQFNTLLTEMNAASQIKAGNFIIPANATPEEVIQKIITTPSGN